MPHFTDSSYEFDHFALLQLLLLVGFYCPPCTAGTPTAGMYFL
jgi:hypothetical protein